MYGQLGQGQLSSLAVPRLVLPGRNIVDAGAPQAGGSMVFLTPWVSSYLLPYGSNRCNLPAPYRPYHLFAPPPPPLTPSPCGPQVHIAAGRYHNMAVTRQGAVFGWG
jgi:hypothetical protein